MDLQFPFAITGFLFLLFLFILFKEQKRSKSKTPVPNLPPGPWKLPFIGSMHHLAGSLPHHRLKDLAKKHGPLMHLQLGEVSAVVVSSPEMAEAVLKTHDLAFAQRPELLASKILTYGATDVVFSPYGDYWRQMRKICVLELLNSRRVQSLSSLREEEVMNVTESIRLSLGSPINLTDKIFLATGALTSRAAFGKAGRDHDTFVSITKEAFSLAGGFDLVDLFPSMSFIGVISGMKSKLEKIHDKADQILENIINEHKEKNQTNSNTGHNELEEEDLVDVLLGLQERGGLQFPITTNNIKAVIWDVFVAGTESSATTVEWAMAELIKNPRVLEKAQAELRQTLKGKKTICERDIQALSYLKLVIKETMRLHPPGPLLLPRECREQCEINGYDIPIKTKIIINAWAIATDPEYWHEPESFIPERFSSNSIDFRGKNFEYIPFGAGRRICPGIVFGVAFIELLLAHLIYHFNWSFPGEDRPEDLDMTESFGASVRRKNVLCLIAASYNSSGDD